MSFYISQNAGNALHFRHDGQIFITRNGETTPYIDTRIKITQEELDKRIKFDRIWRMSLGLHGKQLDTSDADIEGLSLDKDDEK